MQFAVKEKIIAEKDIISYAVFILNEEILGFDIVLEISILETYQDPMPYVKQLIALEKKEDDDFITYKWMYAMLWTLYQKRNLYENPLMIVDIIYSDFGYPEHIKNLIYYMPAENKNEVGENYIYSDWKKYLDTEKEKYILK